MPAGVALQVQQLGAVARPLSVALLTFAVVVSAVAVAATQRNRRRHRDRPATARVAAGREGEFYREALEQLDSAEVRLEYLVHRGGCRTVRPQARHGCASRLDAGYRGRRFRNRLETSSAAAALRPRGSPALAARGVSLSPSC